MTLTVLDLFSGLGGFSLGLERTGGFRTVAFCEIEPFCRRVLAKHWPEVPQYDDVRTLDAARLDADGIGRIDVICGGFPCQDISSAGAKVGIDGARSGLWREYARLIGELRPRYVLVENVAALLGRGLDRVLGDLAKIGFDAEWHCIPASAVGAPHERDRVWIIANPNGHGQPACAKHVEACGRSQARGDEDTHGILERTYVGALGRDRGLKQPISWNGIWGDENPSLGMGVDDGLPQRLDRLRALGNAVVPQIPELLGRAILASMREAA